MQKISMKKTPSIQHFKLPLIQQKYNIINKPSKSNTKRSRFETEKSDHYPKDKQKNLIKNTSLNIQTHFHHKYQQNLQKLKQNISNTKQTTQIYDQKIQEDDDKYFQQKVKENKIWLKKHKLKKQLQNRQKAISTRQNNNTKTNSIEKYPTPIDKLPETISKKNIPVKNRPKKKLISFLAHTDSKDWVNTIMKGTIQVERPSSAKDIKNIKKQNKNYGSDVFQNIHSFLKTVEDNKQSHGNVQQKSVQVQKIYNKLLRYKQKLAKMQQKSLRIQGNDAINESNDKAMSPLSNKLHYYTISQWKKVSLTPHRPVAQLSSSFNHQLQKISQLQSMSSIKLNELLQQRKSFLDLVLLKKLKQKQAQRLKEH